jgi:hypothetical protein
MFRRDTEPPPSEPLQPYRWRRYVLPKVGNHIQDYTASQPTRPQSTLSVYIPSLWWQIKFHTKTKQQIKYEFLYTFIFTVLKTGWSFSETTNIDVYDKESKQSKENVTIIWLYIKVMVTIRHTSGQSFNIFYCH